MIRSSRGDNDVVRRTEDGMMYKGSFHFDLADGVKNAVRGALRRSRDHFLDIVRQK